MINIAVYKTCIFNLDLASTKTPIAKPPSTGRMQPVSRRSTNHHTGDANAQFTCTIVSMSIPWRVLLTQALAIMRAFLRRLT